MAALSAALRTTTSRVEELMEQAASAQAEVLAAEKQAAQGEAVLRRQLHEVLKTVLSLYASCELIASLPHVHSLRASCEFIVSFFQFPGKNTGVVMYSRPYPSNL